ncbi:hypothetical protein DHEL01_v208599 [Diaporthe helianthi]|uniref:Uncharacterized protein n=1 Tax=Diaporthe helianthi TaxID=158607 RepID=A0A2P5HRW8_DIAHE|nr:hypothetical protein DHEL01_v208599 [Diaporthe helianthi]
MTSMPHSDTSSRPRSRETGFPEPFCGSRNTTLPHPDADTSPNACISQDDVSISRVESRQRRSFRAKHKRTISHGLITPEMEQMYSMVAVTSDSESASTREDLERLPTIPGTPAVGHMARPPSKDGGISIASTSTGDNRKSMDHDNNTFRSRLPSDSSSAKSPKRGFMQRLGISHHIS